MRIKRVELHNFRNFKDCAFELRGHAVIVGENKIGKSNLIHALRLIFDPRLPDSERQLRLEDFHDGLSRPLGPDDIISISVDLTDFEDSKDAVSVLGDYVVEPDPMVSRLTYLYRPRPNLGREPQKEEDYEFLIYGGTNPDRRVGHDVRQQITLTLLPALRDAEGDLGSWRRSPLAPLLQAVAAKTNRDQLLRVTEGVTTATGEIAKLPEIGELAASLQRLLDEMVGPYHTIPMALGFSPADADRLLRSLRLFVDDAARPLAEASLGSANLIYLCLWILELERQVAEGQKSHNLLAIEEPEAHLHPHLQRLIFRNFLRTRGGTPADGRTSRAETILLTTHSPQIVSVTPLSSLVLLRRATANTGTEAVSTANLALPDGLVEDLERYLDVTRGEMVFAKGVLLVEGSAEEFVVPSLATHLGHDLDRLGITVCSVNGTDFEPYVRLLGPTGLAMPFAVITDLDPQSGGGSLGIPRIRRLLQFLGGGAAVDDAAVAAEGARAGLFVGDSTLEVDLFRAGQHEALCQTLMDLTANGAARTRAAEWRADPASLDSGRFLKDIEEIGKGRFAQRLAARLRPGACPGYIERAINYVVTRISQPTTRVPAAGREPDVEPRPACGL
ncbi:MAG: AAA family ATPase [Acidobacteriota bacterium]|nr:AAA family ATPase [Acidobacteriota bacterium]